MIDLPDSNFLVPNATAVVEAAVFLVVLFVVSRWVMPRLNATLDQRRRLIEDEIRAASEAAREAQKREKLADDILRQARRDAGAIRDRAYEHGDYVVAEAIRKGREEHAWLTRPRSIPTQTTKSKSRNEEDQLCSGSPRGSS